MDNSVSHASSTLLVKKDTVSRYRVTKMCSLNNLSQSSQISAYKDIPMIVDDLSEDSVSDDNEESDFNITAI